MKRTYLLLLCVVVIAGLIGIGIAKDSGYVFIAWKDFRYESTFWIFVAIIGAIISLIYLLRKLIVMTLVSYGVINPWSQLNKDRRMRSAAEVGLLDLAEGRWDRALRHLIRVAKNEEKPMIYLIGAAKAAQEIGNIELCDQLLNEALERQPEAELAIGLAHAEILWKRAELLEAKKTLKVMHENHPQSKEVLIRLQALMRQMQDWSGILGLLPDLRKQHVLPDTATVQLEQQAWAGRLANASNNKAESKEQALQSLANTWQHLSKNLRHDKGMIEAYARELRRLGAETTAEELLRKALQHGLDDQLLELYGKVAGADLGRQLQLAESWLPQAPKNPALLRTLGRICIKNQLWGKARDYLESSLKFEVQVESCVLLARLLRQQGDIERSNQLFEKSLVLLENQKFEVKRIH